MLPTILSITRFIAGIAIMILDVAQYWKDVRSSLELMHDTVLIYCRNYCRDGPPNRRVGS